MTGLTIDLDLAPPGSRRLAVSAAGCLIAFSAALFLLPANRVLAGMGAVATPAVAIGLVLAAWLVLSHLNPEVGTWPHTSGNHGAILAYYGFAVFAYSWGFSRSLTPLEVSGANRALISTTAHVAVALVACRGLRRRSDVERVTAKLVAFAAVMALVGAVQFFTGLDPATWIRFPGLVSNYELVGVGGRSVFNRPYGMALHPIEFGVVCAAMLPLAIHHLFFATSRRQKRLAAVWISLIGFGIPISISRSAIVALIVGMVAMLGAWGWRQRANVVGAGIAATALVWALVPGLIGTIRSLFTNLGNDPSITARTERVPMVLALFEERPWLGRGLGTYSVDDYFLVDNEWYVSLIELGALGLAALVALLFGSVIAARSGARRSGSEGSRHLGYAIAATILALVASIGTFDAFHFRIFTGLLFMMIGCALAIRGHDRHEEGAADH